MSDQRYEYRKTNVVKIVVENPKGKILLIQEPEDNEWMPGHWGLPGGKPFLKESLYDAFKRKLKGEVGLEAEPLGIFRIEELLIDKRTVLMFIVVVRIDSNIEVKGESNSHKWAGIEEIKKMDITEFSEFYNKNLLLEYLSGNRKIVDFILIETQQYYDMQKNKEYKRWKGSGEKQDS